MIEHLEPQAPPRYLSCLGRPAILPKLCLWAGVLVSVLRGFHSQLSLWRMITERGLWSYPRLPVSDQAIYKRLATGGSAPLPWSICSP